MERVHECQRNVNVVLVVEILEMHHVYEEKSTMRLFNQRTSTCFTAMSRKVRSPRTSIIDLGLTRPIRVPRPPLSLTTTTLLRIAGMSACATLAKVQNLYQAPLQAAARSRGTECGRLQTVSFCPNSDIGRPTARLQCSDYGHERSFRPRCEVRTLALAECTSSSVRPILMRPSLSGT